MNMLEKMIEALREIAASAELTDSPVAQLMATRAQQAIRVYDSARANDPYSEKCMACGSRVTFNGWANYETWAAYNWLSSDQGTEQFIRAVWTEAREDTEDEGSALNRVEDFLRDYYAESMPELTWMYSDLLTSAYQSINWREIARHFNTTTPDED